ncbi:MalY/PatB family protein [Candidatus Epulonipiscium viviparus]|uniref:MalY/PatB family protein n=1 Tax=Candidatus Epulonipiscium viviparus TaxID=420336 RepID=UPI00273804E3|nr:MalY/PatB family protein [Candidatus Epulopiscium viviparus]
MYDLQTIVSRNDTAASKVDKSCIKSILNVNCFDDSIPMWVADMDFACAPAILEALHKRVDKAIFGYTSRTADYFDSIIDWYSRRHNMQIDPSWLVFNPGTVIALRNCLRAFTKEGDGVIIQPPVYYPFQAQILETNRTVINNNLIKDDNNHYSIDFEDFEKKCKDPNTKIFIYCNPHNPVGQIWPPADTKRLLDICAKHDVIIFSDEIHCDLIRASATFTSALNIDSTAKLIVATAVTKTFNVAGLQITNLVISDATMRAQLNAYTGKIDISPFASAATIAAYNESENWVLAVNEALDANLDYMDTFIKNKLPRLKFVKPEGTYLTWIDFSDYNIENQTLLEKIANEAHLILESGTMFGQSGTGFIRMNIACPKSIVIEALDRLYKVFGE